MPSLGIVHHARRTTGETLSRGSRWRRIPDVLPTSVKFHHWTLGFGQCSSHPIAQALQGRTIHVFCYAPLFDHALVPSPFRVQVRRSPRSHRLELRPPLEAIPSVRDMAHSFPSSSSSLSNAPCGTRWCSVQRLAMDLSVTGGMQEHTVVCRIAPPVGPPDPVMVMPSRESGDRLVADGTETVLLFPQVQQLSSAFEGVRHLHAEAFLKVHFPLRVVRVCRPCDLHMPLDWHVSCTTEREFLRLPAAAHARPDEGPPASVSRRKVF